MTQVAIIKALQNGSLTSHQISEITGMTQATVISTARKLKTQGKLSSKMVKSGRYWVAEYTLEDSLITDKLDDEETRCKLNPFDIRNAKGIFTTAEYAVMKQQATRLFGKPGKKEITNNQFI